jgi:hypothetical protein
LKVVSFDPHARHRARGLALTALASTLFVGLALTGCEQIAGIERRRYLGDGGLRDGGPEQFDYPSKAQCDEFCGVVTESCNETSGVFAYKKDTQYCNSLCRHLPKARDPGNADGTNSFECRKREADNAFGQKGDPDEGAQSCRSTGAGGAPYCGSNCEAYCQLFANVCADTPTKPREDCLEECEALASDDSLDADKSFSNNDADTVECRLSHLGAAATAKVAGSTGETALHCEHASIYVDKLSPCMTATPRCTDYCELTMNTCHNKGEEDLRQYETLQDCLNVCAKGPVNSLELEAGKTQDKDRDTVACRRYHAYNALLFDRPYHCNHAGPAGDGHCGDLCTSYCQLVKKACERNGYNQDFPNGDEQCKAQCEMIPAVAALKQADKPIADLKYNVGLGQAGKDTIQCRLYHTSKAFGSPATECEHALGRTGSKCDD